MHVNVFPCKLAVSDNLGHTPSAGTHTNWLPLQIITRPASGHYSEKKGQREAGCELKNKIRAGNYFSKNNAVVFSAVSQIFAVRDLRDERNL